MKTVNGESDMIEIDTPPSLQQRAPERIDLTLLSGRPLIFSRGRAQVRAGSTLVLQVTPQSPNAQVAVTTRQAVQVTVPLSAVESGSHIRYVGYFSDVLWTRLFPIRQNGMLQISIANGRSNPCLITIPITFWPSIIVYFLWSLGIFCVIMRKRFEQVFGDSNSFSDACGAIYADLPYLLTLLGVVGIGFGFLFWTFSSVSALLIQDEDSTE